MGDVCPPLAPPFSTTRQAIISKTCEKYDSAEESKQKPFKIVLEWKLIVGKIQKFHLL